MPLPEMNRVYQKDTLLFSSTLANKSINLVLTDPPYNVKKNYGVYKDNLPTEQYWKWCKELVDEWKRISDKKIVIVVGSKILREWWNLIPDAKLVIVKMGAISNNKEKNLHLQYHPVLTTVESNTKYYDLWNDIRWPGEGYFFNEERYGHPAMTPLKLMRRCVQFFSNENDIVYEPFCGVGTVPVACQLLNRRWLATELNPNYIETTNERIKKASRGIL